MVKPDDILFKLLKKENEIFQSSCNFIDKCLNTYFIGDPLHINVSSIFAGYLQESLSFQEKILTKILERIIKEYSQYWSVEKILDKDCKKVISLIFSLQLKEEDQKPAW